MARQKPAADNGSWDYAQELLDRGDPAFVDELQRSGFIDALYR